MEQPTRRLWISLATWPGLFLLFGGLAWGVHIRSLSAIALLIGAAIHMSMVLMAQWWSVQQEPRKSVKLRDVAGGFWLSAAGLAGIIFAMAIQASPSTSGPWLALVLGIWVTYRTTLLCLQIRGWATPLILEGAMRQMQGNLMFLAGGTLIATVSEFSAWILFMLLFILAPIANIIDKKRW